MMPTALHLAGQHLMLDPMGALYWTEQRVLVVADLHLEKGSSLARKGMLLPPWDTHTTLHRLTLLLHRWSPRTVICLGDSFHDNQGYMRLPRTEECKLKALTHAHQFVWMLGNHDFQVSGILPGACIDIWRLGPITFRHQASVEFDSLEVVGHYHPKATIVGRAKRVRRSCFVSDGQRIILPAFGAYTGGLDVCDPAIASLFPHGYRVFVLGKDRLFSFDPEKIWLRD